MGGTLRTQRHTHALRVEFGVLWRQKVTSGHWRKPICRVHVLNRLKLKVDTADSQFLKKTWANILLFRQHQGSPVPRPHRMRGAAGELAKLCLPPPPSPPIALVTAWPIPPAPCVEKPPSTKPGPGAQKVGDPWATWHVEGMRVFIKTINKRLISANRLQFIIY